MVDSATDYKCWLLRLQPSAGYGKMRKLTASLLVWFSLGTVVCLHYVLNPGPTRQHTTLMAVLLAVNAASFGFHLALMMVAGESGKTSRDD